MISPDSSFSSPPPLSTILSAAAAPGSSFPPAQRGADADSFPPPPTSLPSLLVRALSNYGQEIAEVGGGRVVGRGAAASGMDASSAFAPFAPASRGRVSGDGLSAKKKFIVGVRAVMAANTLRRSSTTSSSSPSKSPGLPIEDSTLSSSLRSGAKDKEAARPNSGPRFFRWASSAASGHCLICCSDVDGGGVDRGLRLGCSCLFHCGCISGYVKAELGDRNRMQRRGGILCPASNYGCDRDETGGDDRYYLRCEEILRLAEIYEEGVQSGEVEPLDNPITRMDAEKVARFMGGEEKSGGGDDEDAPGKPDLKRESSSAPYIEATTKQCPGCPNRESHFHGHQCHAVKCDDAKCNTEYCFRCLSPGPENLEERGRKENCKCGLWHNFCRELQDPDDFEQHIQLEPYPHDKRCGCAICPDCRVGDPCLTCVGNCCVCLGHVRPGPTELGMAWSPVLDSGEKELQGYALLYDAAEKGRIADVAKALREGQLNVNRARRGADGLTALILATINGRTDVVKLLLKEKDIDAGKKDTHGNSSLFYGFAFCIQAVTAALNAAGAAREAVVFALLPQFFELPESILRREGELLYAAYKGDSELIAKLLQEEEIDVTHACSLGFAPLHYAVLELGGPFLSSGNQSETELFTVLNESYLQAADHLMLCCTEAQIVIDELGHCLSCPFRRKRNGAAATALLGHKGIDVNQEVIAAGFLSVSNCLRGLTALHFAVLRNSGSIDALLQHEGIDVNRVSVGGSLTGFRSVTPLHMATIFVQRDAVSALLLHKDIDINKIDACGRSPLHYAAMEARFLERSIKLCSNSDATAMRAWSAEIVSMLLMREEIDADKADIDGVTPFLLAVKSSHVDCVDLLLKHDTIDVNRADGEGDTPLHFAVELAISKMGRAKTVLSMLLDHERIDVNSADHRGSTALHYVAAKTHDRLGGILMERLLRSDAVDPNKVDFAGATPLHLAAVCNAEHAMRLLLLHHRIDVNKTDKNGYTPLHLAAAHNNTRCVRLLVGHDKIDVCKRGGPSGETAFRRTFANAGVLSEDYFETRFFLLLDYSPFCAFAFAAVANPLITRVAGYVFCFVLWTLKALGLLGLVSLAFSAWLLWWWIVQLGILSFLYRTPQALYFMYRGEVGAARRIGREIWSDGVCWPWVSWRDFFAEEEIAPIDTEEYRRVAERTRREVREMLDRIEREEREPGDDFV